MTQRKICGFDVNGWRDIVARNWQVLPGEEEEIGPVACAECGPLSSIVKIAEEHGDRWVGGRQADLAPHGMGGGWGAVGQESRRLTVRNLLKGRVGSALHLAAAFDGLAKGAAYNVVAIDDTPDSTEAARERMLAGLAAAKLRNPMLVWRPVLALLYAIDAGFLTQEQMIGVICHAPEGLSVQKLLLRRAQGQTDDVLTPERHKAARMVSGDIGYANLVRSAREAAIGPAGLSSRTAHLALARSVGRCALGLACPPEILRQQNGDWDVIALEDSGEWSGAALDEDLSSMGDCALVLVETLAEGRVREALLKRISESISGPIKVLPVDAVALGALVAARRLAEGDPVYFDFLPRISTIVFGQSGAQSFDLIDESETLEAGRVYRSPKPAFFAIPAGHSSVSIYLRKEAEPHPRKATVTLDAPLKAPAPVSLWVEQKPAAGAARIVLEASGLGQQFTIDWQQALDDERPWSDIIAALDTPPPSIPARLVLKCGLRPWEDSKRAPGLFSLLGAETDQHPVDWKNLADKLTARPFGEYCISSDGELPSAVSTENVELLDVLTEAAMSVTRTRLQAERTSWNSDNDALRFLTWQFRRCPEEVATWLIDCVQSRELPMFAHPMVDHPSSWILVYQGLARIAYDEPAERRIIKMLLSTRVRDWNWRVESACLAILLSRSDTAPGVLVREDIERLVRRNISDFRANLRSEYTKFYYAPFLLAGLLRWRLKDPRGLLLGHDPLAASLKAAIEDAENDFDTRRQPKPAFLKKREKYLPILADLKSELEGAGGNPDLLLDIYGDGV
jgi:hypothetical protein